jgi:hypothetical protein
MVPGFTAERALYRSRNVYRGGGAWPAEEVWPSEVVPATKICRPIYNVKTGYSGEACYFTGGAGGGTPHCSPACNPTGSLPYCCYDGCKDLDSDPGNCGACGNDCAVYSSLFPGTGDDCCHGKCTDTDSDPDNCGGCGGIGGSTNAYNCASGLCCAGVCCQSEQSCCGGVCVPTVCGPNTCGGCPACSGGQNCVSGSCQCPVGQTWCGDTCLNLNGNDSSNCGGCGVACDTAKGEQCCSGLCVNLDTDLTNCGACGFVCPDPFLYCAGGQCSNCPEGQTMCNGNCVAPPAAGADQGSGNYMFYSSYCQPIKGLTVTLTAGDEDLVSPNGFSFQLNAWPTKLTHAANPCNSVTNRCDCPAPSGVCWMQYIIWVTGNEAQAFIQYWDNSGICNGTFQCSNKNCTDENPVIAQLPNANTLPAGWSLEIALGNDSSGNVNSINLSVVDDQGTTKGSIPFPIPTHSTTCLPALNPILGFWVDVVGPPSSVNCGTDNAQFSSGRGCITYNVPDGSDSICGIAAADLDCPDIDALWGVCESSKMFYGSLDPNCDTTLDQSFSLSTS